MTVLIKNDTTQQLAAREVAIQKALFWPSMTNFAESRIEPDKEKK